MRHDRAVLAAFLAGLVGPCATACSASNHPAIATVPIVGKQSPRPRSTSVIQHVIIVIQENRTFDNLFWGYPGADSTTTCAKNHSGGCTPMIHAPLYQACDLDHSPTGFAREFDGGKMDGFDKEYDSCNKVRTLAYQYTQQPDIVPYWQMAQQYALSDRMFQSNGGPSFPAHQYLIAGQSGYNNNPPGMPWGCDGQTVECFNYNTLADLMDGAGVSWKYYAPGGDNTKNLQALSIWSAYDAISHIRYGNDWTNGDQTTTKQFFADVTGGALPQVSWIVPNGVNSDHPGKGAFGTGNADKGPAWVASVVDAVGQSQYWQNTAIIVTWDDWGGWYDHVPPQQLDSNGLGFRVPLIIISPYAKAGYVSHVNHEFGSILHYTENNFNLGSLGTVDARADDLSDMFDYAQTPISFKNFAHTRYDELDTSAPDDY